MAVIDYIPCDSGINNLRVAIIENAAMELARAERDRVRFNGLTEAEEAKAEAVRRFLLSDWGQWLSGGYGYSLVKMAIKQGRAGHCKGGRFKKREESNG